MKKSSTWTLVLRTVAISFLFSLLALLPLLAHAEALNINTPTRFAGFVKVDGSRAVYVDYLKPQAGEPTLVLLNGLTYNLGCFDAFVNQLKGHGFGILRYDPNGMGETLLRYAPSLAVVDYHSQVNDLAALLDVLGLKDPVHVVGLSYGGGIAIEFAAAYPERIATITSIAPYTEPLPGTDNVIKMDIQQTRIMSPFNPATDDQLYAFFFHQIVYATYPSAEPIVLSNPFILESVYNLGLGIRGMLIKDVVDNLPDGKFNLMVANQDEYVPADTLSTLWNETPVAKRGSRIFIEGTKHKMPETIPAFAAEWVLRIVNGDPTIQGGHTFYGDANTNTVRSTLPRR